MRWIIALTLIAAVALIGWFLYPRLKPAIEEDPLSHLPEDVWMIVELRNDEGLSILTDSSHIFYRYGIFDDLIESAQQLPSTFFDDYNRVLIARYGEDQKCVLALNGDSKQNIEGFEFNYEGADFKLWSTTSLESTHTADDLHELMTLPLVDDHMIRMHTKSSALLATFTPFFDPLITQQLTSEIQADQWISFDAWDQDGHFVSNGIGKFSKDESSRKRDVHLMKYLPTNTAACIIQTLDTSLMGVALCPYDYISQDPFTNVFILTEVTAISVVPEDAEQTYRDIPITLGSPSEALSSMNIPWIEDAYVAHLGDVQVSSVSFEQLMKFIDDFLADDKLIKSNYYVSLEKYISDASFSLFLRPDLLTQDNPFIQNAEDIESINAMMIQAFSELPEQKFYSIALIHDREIIDAASKLWTASLDGEVIAGPWPFKNHYTKKSEVLVQDDRNQLYLINHEGKTIWKRKLDNKVVGDIRMVDAYDNGKYQVLLNTLNKLHLIDRNGKDVSPFPIGIQHGASIAPSLIKYEGSKDYRLLYSDGAAIRNIDLEGEEVKGWDTPMLDEPPKMAIEYLYFNGKDYLVTATRGNQVLFMNRTGKERVDPISFDSNAIQIELLLGNSLASCQFISHDSLGNIYIGKPGASAANVKNVMQFGSDVGFEVGASDEHRYLTVKGDHFVSLDKDFNVRLDYLLPEAVEAEIQWVSEEQQWVGFWSGDSKHYYILDLEGAMLDKMPLDAMGTGLLLDLDEQGALEFVVPNGSRELVAFELSD